MGVGNVALSGVKGGAIKTPGCMHPDALRAALGREPKQDEAPKKRAEDPRAAVEGGGGD